MKVDLRKLNIHYVADLINWCVANRIDYDKANALKFAWYSWPAPEVKDNEWVLDIPEEHMTYFLLKWK